MDMLAKAQIWLAKVRKESLATENELAYIVNETGERIEMTGEGVVVGSSDQVLDQSLVITLDVEERDYIIPVDLFQRRLRTWTFEPRRGDIIEETTCEGRTFIFRVVPFGGDVAWEWHDRERTAYRVHCQQIGTSE